jgi:predicted nucleotidyltransferase
LVREKTLTGRHAGIVVYDADRWRILEEKRSLAIPVMENLSGFEPIVHGSVARGDVTAGSDVDIVIPREVPSYALELALGGEPVRREIVQATPWHLVKAHIYVEDEVSVTFPLVKPTPLEEQFYSFGGSADLSSLRDGKRSAGIDKRLVFIEPVPEGHLESGVVGREALVAKAIGVGVDIVRERVDVLSRRDSVGRTGVYLKRALLVDESFEDVLRQLASRDTNVKRRAQSL